MKNNLLFLIPIIIGISIVSIPSQAMGFPNLPQNLPVDLPTEPPSSSSKLSTSNKTSSMKGGENVTQVKQGINVENSAQSSNSNGGTVEHHHTEVQESQVSTDNNKAEQSVTTENKVSNQSETKQDSNSDKNKDSDKNQDDKSDNNTTDTADNTKPKQDGKQQDDKKAHSPNETDSTHTPDNAKSQPGPDADEQQANAEDTPDNSNSQHDPDAGQQDNTSEPNQDSAQDTDEESEDTTTESIPTDNSKEAQDNNTAKNQQTDNNDSTLEQNSTVEVNQETDNTGSTLASTVEVNQETDNNGSTLDSTVEVKQEIVISNTKEPQDDTASTSNNDPVEIKQERIHSDSDSTVTQETESHDAQDKPQQEVLEPTQASNAEDKNDSLKEAETPPQPKPSDSVPVDASEPQPQPPDAEKRTLPTPAEIAQLDAAAISALSIETVSALTPAHIVQIQVTATAGFQPAQIEALNFEAAIAFKAAQLVYMTPAAKAAFDATERGYLPRFIFSTLSVPSAQSAPPAQEVHDETSSDTDEVTEAKEEVATSEGTEKAEAHAEAGKREQNWSSIAIDVEGNSVDTSITLAPRIVDETGTVKKVFDLKEAIDFQATITLPADDPLLETLIEEMATVTLNVYAQYLPLDADDHTQPLHFVLDAKGNILPLPTTEAGAPSIIDLVPFKEGIAYQSRINVPIYQGKLLAPGQLSIWMSLQLPDGTQVVNEQPVALKIL